MSPITNWTFFGTNESDTGRQVVQYDWIETTVEQSQNSVAADIARAASD